MGQNLGRGAVGSVARADGLLRGHDRLPCDGDKVGIRGLVDNARFYGSVRGVSVGTGARGVLRVRTMRQYRSPVSRRVHS